MEQKNISNSDLKLLNLLALKKYRTLYSQFTAENTKIVQELSMEGIFPEKVFTTLDYLDANQWLEDIITPIIITESELSKVSNLATPSGIIAVFKQFENPEIQKYPINIFADNIRDPGNLGTIIRLCDWYGIKQLFINKGSVDIYNPKTIHASMGSIARVCIYSKDVEEVLDSTGAFPIVTSLDDSADSIWNLKNIEEKEILLIIGNESNGVSLEILNKGFQTVIIPRFGKAESLNVAFATAICLDNLKRIKSY